MKTNEHLVTIYENDAMLLNLLQGFVEEGLRGNDCVIIITNDEHIKAMHKLLRAHGFAVPALISEGQLIVLNAHESLARFMVNGWPDEGLFNTFIDGLLLEPVNQKRHVRIFGEMVALLWEQGYTGATIQLESMWDEVCKTKELQMLCAYPKSVFKQDVEQSLHYVCSAHSRIIPGQKHPDVSVHGSTIKK